MATITVNDLRISFIQLELYPQSDKNLDGLISDNTPAKFLRTPWEYEDEFENALGNTSNFWKIPKHEHGQNFWKFYLDHTRIQKAKPQAVVSHLVPAFLPSIVTATCEKRFNTTVTCHGYGYPHAFGADVTLQIKGPLTLNQILDRSMVLHAKTDYSIKSPIQGAHGINSLISVVMDTLREILTGNKQNSGSQGQIFSVATFVDANGGIPAANLQTGDLVNQALYGLCTWNPAWNKSNPNPAEFSLKPFRSEEILGSAFYGNRYARAVWLPGYFDLKDRYVNYLSCYHRNLTLLSMQVESLIQLVLLATNYIPNKIIPIPLQEYIEDALKQLYLLYMVESTTYRSVSAPTQIKIDKNIFNKINQVRVYFNLPPLVP